MVLTMFTVVYKNYVKCEDTRNIGPGHERWKSVNLLLVHKLFKKAKRPGNIGVCV